MVQVSTIKLLVAAGALLVCLTGCQTPSGSFCQIASPIRPSAETIATLTDAEVAAILQHNEKGKRLCRWKP